MGQPKELTMSYQLRADEIMQALRDSKAPGAAALVASVEATVNAAADALARHLGIEAGTGDFQGLAFAGLCVPFHPASEDQPLPDVLNGYDDEDEWEFFADCDDLGEAATDGLGRPYVCDACGRPEADCSAAPCPGVVADRES
jgi:predicted RecB family endonuclease